jgi:hypothetical protein
MDEPPPFAKNNPKGQATLKIKFGEPGDHDSLGQPLEYIAVGFFGKQVSTPPDDPANKRASDISLPYLVST